MFFIIDPKHGGDDRGAVIDGVHEADVNVGAAHQLERVLREFAPTYLTREHDDTKNLWERKLFERKVKAKHNSDGLVIVLRCEESENETKFGMLVHKWHDNTRSFIVARTILRSAPDELIAVNDIMDLAKSRILDVSEGGDREAFNACGNYISDTLVVGMGFLTNEHDRTLLVKHLIKERIAASILCGALHWGTIVRRW